MRGIQQETVMTRLDSPTRVTVRPTVNVYTGLTALSMLATLAALIYMVMQYLKAQ
jgi:hypothetical protein